MGAAQHGAVASGLLRLGQRCIGLFDQAFSRFVHQVQDVCAFRKKPWRIFVDPGIGFLRGRTGLQKNSFSG